MHVPWIYRLPLPSSLMIVRKTLAAMFSTRQIFTMSSLASHTSIKAHEKITEGNSSYGIPITTLSLEKSLLLLATLK